MIGEWLHFVSMDEVDVVVIGAGVIGLAVARAVAAHGRDTLVLEAAAGFGSETSSRNSEVVHAGIHYRPGTLKATLCVRGRELLYEFCERHGVGYRRCGKLIVAVSESELAQLEALHGNARANGVELELLDSSQARALEPALSCAGALHSPLSGIVDTHACMLALLGQAQDHAATFVFNTRVSALEVSTNGILIAVNGADPVLRARQVINCAGLYAPHVAHLMRGFPAERIPSAYFVKGSYFALSARAPFQRLLYPLPAQGGLGIHLTIDLAGRARFGPDAQWVEQPDYNVEPERAALFYPAIRPYWPALPDGALHAAYAGVRPRISAPGAPLADFRIEGPETHGVRGVVNLFGIESPGLTASLAIARHVLELLEPLG